MSVNAFGVDHGPVSKIDADKTRKATGSAIAGGGAVAAGTGFVAGGVPGSRPDGNAVFRVKHGEGTGVRRAVSGARGAAPAAKAVHGGILGFRGSIHQLGTHFFKEQAKIDEAKRRPNEAKTSSFYRGYNAGKIGPEEAIMRGMKVGRRASHGVLAAGVGATAYGVHRAATKTPVKKDADRYNGALVGAGTAGVGVTHAGSRYLGSQQRKFATRASTHVDEAGKLVPAIAGRQGKQMNLRQISAYKRKNPGAEFPKTMHPTVRDGEIKRNPKLLHGVPREAAEQAGRLRGAAAQERHFSEVFGSTEKVVRHLRAPSAIVAAVGAGGLAANRKHVSKSANMGVSAFGVDHGNRGTS